MGLERGNQRVQKVRQEQRRVGIRCQCGPFFKTLSVENDTPFSEVKIQIAERWDRPIEALSFIWRHGPDIVTLQTEEQWKQCMLSCVRNETIELKIVLDRTKVASPKSPSKGNKKRTRRVGEAAKRTEQKMQADEHEVVPS